MLIVNGKSQSETKYLANMQINTTIQILTKTKGEAGINRIKYSIKTKDHV